MGKARIDQAFAQVLERGDKAFVPYIMAGDGGIENLQEQILFLQESGATVVEIGIPFSDPVADGPTIQEAGKRALAQGVTLEAILESLREWKESRTIPIVLMTYFNLAFAYGIERFAEECVSSGVDGLIIPDLPLEEEDLIAPTLSKREIALIRLAAPTSPPSRLEEIAKRTEGFLYAVTVKGTTGARIEYEDGIAEYLDYLKALSSVPVLAGFGISTPEQVRGLGKHSDGVIVGSRIVQLLADGKREKVTQLIHAAKQSETVQ